MEYDNKVMKRGDCTIYILCAWTLGLKLISYTFPISYQ